MNLKDQLKECDELYESEDYKGLIKKCDEILEKYPDNQNAMGYKGISHCFLDEYDEALKILERAVELYPKNYYLKNNLAMVYYDLGDYEKSLELCEEGLKIKKFDWLCENKFKNLIKLDRMDEAIEFEKTLDSDFNLPLLFLEEDIADYELDYYYRLLKDDPDDYYVIDMIKSVTAYKHPNMTPEVGDYYLKWIDAIKFKSDSEDLYVECDNLKLKEYVHFKIFSLNTMFKDAVECLKLDEIRKKSVPYDDEEFNAFINHLIEIKYLSRPKKDCVKLGEDNSFSDRMKKETEVDNSRLEELIKQDITPEMEKEFFEVLKKSRLFMPIDFGYDAFQGIEDKKPGDKIEGPRGFSIQFLTDSEGRKAVPLFTSEEMIKKAGALTSAMIIYMEDLADMLKQTDKYSVIAINPLTEFDLNMPIEAFLAQFEDSY